jgi:phospholipid/cholesterol/gamma-HCH transport system substrate-binding protein
MKPRVLVNLAFFAVIGVVLSIWAVGDILQIDLRNPPYEISAAFEDSPGLQPGYDVGYLGTPIGRIRSVELAEGHVEVTMAIDADREIPEGSEFAVRRKSAVGEPYVDITPPEGATADGPVMAEGDHVPVERTLTPLSYSELFAALDDLVASVPEDDLASLLHEVAAGLDGRAGSLRDLIVGGGDALDTFAENADLLEDTTASLSRLTRVFADHGESVRQGLANTEAVTGSLAAARADLERVMVDGDDLASRTAALLDESGDDLSCTLGGLSSVAAGLNRSEVVAALSDLLATAPDAAEVFRDVVAWEADGPYVRAIPPINVGNGPPVPVYEEPTVLPEVAGVPGCPALGAHAAPGGGTTTGAGGHGQAEAGPTPAADPGPDQDLATSPASSDRETDGSAFNPLLAVAALLGLALLAATRPWRIVSHRAASRLRR